MGFAITQAIVREFLHYQPRTGLLFWKRRDRKWFKTDGSCKIWNKRFAGKRAFTAIGSHGYYCGGILGQPVLAHRVIWLWMTGAWPREEIDHWRDHDTLNNRWRNLREATHEQNQRNRALAVNNTSGICGVRQESSGKYVAWLEIHRKNIVLGRFPTPEAAEIARKRADRKHGFAEAHGRSPEGNQGRSGHRLL